MESTAKHKREAKAFRDWLKASGLTPETFSRLSPNFHYSTIVKWAGGFSTPSEQSLRDIQEVRPDCPFVKELATR